MSVSEHVNADEGLVAMVGAALQRCRVEDAPNPLFNEGDVYHVSHMVAAAIRGAGWVHRDEVAGAREAVAAVLIREGFEPVDLAESVADAALAAVTEHLGGERRG